MSDLSMGIDTEKKLSVSFHRTFPLNRESVRIILELAIKCSDSGQLLTNKIISEETSLGSVYVEAMPKYTFGSGLITSNRKPTQFGQCVHEYDSGLIHPMTHWLMHYYLSSRNSPGPEFWYLLVQEFFVPDRTFSDDDVLNYLCAKIPNLKKDTLSEAKTVFLNTYLQTDGFGYLNLLNKDGGNYLVNYPEPASIWVMGVALLEYWQACFPGQRMINLHDIIGESEFARIFMVGTRSINRMLAALQEIRYIDLFTTAPPYGVALLRNDLSPLLERMYTSDEID